MNLKSVIVIGGGPGGYVAAIRASQLGARVVLIEEDRIGGTCLNRGCIPTKSLLFDAHMLRRLNRSTVFPSLNHNPVDLLRAMMERKRHVVHEMVKGVELLLESHRVTVKHGRAELLGPQRVLLLNGEEKREVIEADSLLLAPGSKTKVIPGFSPDGETILTSDEALEVSQIPHECVIVGGGYIGVEFATFLSALGSNVTIVEILENILPGLEGELVRNLRRFLERDGVRVLTGSRIEEIKKEERGLQLVVRTPQRIETLEAGKLLLAVGREPRLELSFSRAGVETSPLGIRVNRRMETTAPHVYAIGDATGGTLLAHVAMEQGVIVAENVMGMEREVEEHPLPLCVFTDPEIASVGLTENEARAKGEIKIGRFPFRSNPTAVISGEADGLIKVIVGREDDRILGVHIIGHDASTLISTATSMMRQGAKAKEFAGMMQAHPTGSEALKEAFLDTDGSAIHLPRPLRQPKR